MTKVDDVIGEEKRRRRQTYAELLGFDLHRIIEDLQRLERESGANVVERPPRKPIIVPQLPRPNKPMQRTIFGRR